MQRTIDLHDLPKQLDTVLRAVTVEHTPYVIDQDGRPAAAIVPYNAFVRLSAPDAAQDEENVESVVEDALAELDAVRAHIDTLGWDDIDSANVLCGLRDERDAQLDAAGAIRGPSGMTAMSKQIELSELQRRGEAILDDLARERLSYVVARDGEPEAALIPYSDFRRWQAMDVVAHERFDRMIERLGWLNAGFSEEEIARDVAEAIAEVRRGDP